MQSERAERQSSHPEAGGGAAAAADAAATAEEFFVPLRSTMDHGLPGTSRTFKDQEVRSSRRGLVNSSAWTATSTPLESARVTATLCTLNVEDAFAHCIRLRSPRTAHCALAPSQFPRERFS